jgi:hypothetical protein
MKLAALEAMMSANKLSAYLLSAAHPDGRSKAEYLGRLGYSREAPGRLESDLREQILSLEAEVGRPSRYGQKYEILGPLTGPNGKTAWVRTIWIVLAGEMAPRLVTLPGGEAMTLALYQRVVLTEDLPKEGLRAGDVGVIVEHYPARADVPEGYELEVFAANGQTVAVVSVPASAVREATEHEVLSVREMARA